MYQVIILSHFKKQLKRYTKKYRDLKQAVISALENFDKRQANSLGNNLYKLRLMTKSVTKSKSKSFRMIVFLIELEKFIVPIAIYFKGDQTEVTKKEINRHLEQISLELDF